jgi:TRAP-type uncharacterized transport system fused permease subunit
MFVLSPELLIIETSFTYLIWIICTALGGMMTIGAGIIGYWYRRLYLWERLLGIAGGLCLIYPETITDIIGIVSFVTMLILQLVVKPEKVLLEEKG